MAQRTSVIKTPKRKTTDLNLTFAKRNSIKVNDEKREDSYDDDIKVLDRTWVKSEASMDRTFDPKTTTNSPSPKKWGDGNTSSENVCEIIIDDDNISEDINILDKTFDPSNAASPEIKINPTVLVSLDCIIS